MNFNLISPSSQGYDYVTRFREDIVIPANSKAYLNFAQFTKQNAVNLTEDQEIRVSSTDLYPKFNPTTFNANKIDPTTARVSIKAGTYDFTKFQNAITEALNGIALLPIKQLYYYNSNIPLPDIADRTRISLGYFLQEGGGSNFNTVDLVFDPTDQVGFGQTGDAEYTKTSVTASPAIYDAYAGSSLHYWHLAVPCEDDVRNSNIIQLETNKNMFDLQGGVCMFLYSPEYTALKGGGANYIGGTNLPLTPATGAPDSSYVPRAFVIFEVKKTSSVVNLNIFQARETAASTSDLLKDFNFNTNFVSKKKVTKINLSTVYNTLDMPAKLVVQTYTPVNTDFTSQDIRLYYKVFAYDHKDAEEEPLTEIYDSKQDNSYFSYGFFNTYNPPVNANQANSGIPLKIGLSAQVQGEGFEKCIFTPFDKSTDTATETRAIINTYTIQVSPQLAKYLDTDGTLGPLFPNVCDAMKVNRVNLYVDQQLSLDYLNDNYSVMIDELPISSWKNKEDLADGGYTQAIIANVPSPFVNAFSQTNKDDNFISCNYEPNFQSPNSMRNQDIRTNQLRVRIINMRTDRPAEELTQSIINFTIESPQKGKIEEV